MNRTKALRERIGWSQAALGEFLGVAQSAVHRYENGQEPPGSASRLLDLLDNALTNGVIAPGASPSDCLAAIGATPSNGNPQAAE